MDKEIKDEKVRDGETAKVRGTLKCIRELERDERVQQSHGSF